LGPDEKFPISKGMTALTAVHSIITRNDKQGGKDLSNARLYCNVKISGPKDADKKMHAQ
jgi:hypothetical protein